MTLALAKRGIGVEKEIAEKMLQKMLERNDEKFSNIDILQFMREIVKKHTTSYQSDFEIDKEILLKAASKQEQQDRTFIWMCRTRGTWILNERDVFIKDTREYNTFTFYMEQTSEPVLAFVVEVTEACNGTVYGNIYAINYESFYKHVHDKALDVAYIVMKYECGVRSKDADAVINNFPDKEYGKLQSFQYQPYSQEELADLLHKEKQEREHFSEENPMVYIVKL